MTHDILRSDIELATRLREDKRPDDEIIAALVLRGIESAKAAQLITDLRNGLKPTDLATLPPEFGLGRRSRAKSAERGSGQSRPQPAPEAQSHSNRPVRPASQGRNDSAVSRRNRAILIALAALVVVGGGILLFHYISAGTDSTEEHALKAPAAKVNGPQGQAPATTAAPVRRPSYASLVLELQPDGLHIGGSLVTRSNILPATANLLGAPTRTNRVAQTGTVIYAYDQQGLLIYSQRGGGTNSIILDCEASGGTHGTTSPFTGTLTIDGAVIQADTAPQTLTAIKPLGLSHPGSDNTIWGGRYNNLGLVFAYLKSPRRLSLIEIDLK